MPQCAGYYTRRKRFKPGSCRSLKWTGTMWCGTSRAHATVSIQNAGGFYSAARESSCEPIEGSGGGCAGLNVSMTAAAASPSTTEPT
jgi:hypothetical protein